MTEKLFYRDSHMQEFSAEVEQCIPDGKEWLIVLGQTAFFPEGGGQYADTGSLGEAHVLDVQEKEGVIFHRSDAPLPVGSRVEGKIDWSLRFMKMQQHTGEHIVSGLIHRRFGYQNVGFHLGSEDCTMDFNGEITKEQLREIEWEANHAVVRDLAVEVTYPDERTLETLAYRSKIEIEGQVRIVTIPGYDVCACCAPHVKTTGEIGQIRLTDVQRYKGGVRITMLCGVRALEDAQKKSDSTREISAMLCVKEDEISEGVSRLKEECAQWKTAYTQLRKELLTYRAKELFDQPGEKIVFARDLSGEEPRFLMNQILKSGCPFCAVFSGQESEGFKYVIGSASMDLRAICKGLNEAFEGRGGGKSEMVQGSVKGTEEELRVWIQKKVGEMNG